MGPGAGAQAEGPQLPSGPVVATSWRLHCSVMGVRETVLGLSPLSAAPKARRPKPTLGTASGALSLTQPACAELSLFPFRSQNTKPRLALEEP